MLPDICVRVGENAGRPAIGNPSPGGGLLDSELRSSGPRYTGTLSSGACVGKPLLSAMAQAPTTFDILLEDAEGNPVDLTPASEVRFIVREMTFTDYRYIDKACEVDPDPSTGMLALTLDSEDVPHAGLWEAGFLPMNSDGKPLAEYSVYLELKKSMNYERSSEVDPITIGEIRMALYDRCAEDNEFLDDVEFRDDEIAYAIRRVVDLWNEEAPAIAGSMYTTTTFPYRFHGVDAACGELMRMKGLQLARNRMPFSTGSGKVDDKARADLYIQLGNSILQEYKQWMRREKYRLNANNIYGGVGRGSAPIYANPLNSRR